MAESAANELTLYRCPECGRDNAPPQERLDQRRVWHDGRCSQHPELERVVVARPETIRAEVVKMLQREVLDLPDGLRRGTEYAIKRIESEFGGSG